jgi:hypothetical protein
MVATPAAKLVAATTAACMATGAAGRGGSIVVGSARTGSASTSGASSSITPGNLPRRAASMGYGATAAASSGRS